MGKRKQRIKLLRSLLFSITTLLFLGLVAWEESSMEGKGVLATLTDHMASGEDSRAKPLRLQSLLPVSSSADKRKLPIYSVDTEKNQIAISFDAAWGAEDFERIMEILDKHQVKTTFFMTGNWVRDNPECVKQLVKKGHDLGNHSEHHYDMVKLSKKEMAEELQGVYDQVKELTGYEIDLFRPPYGSYDNAVIEVAEENGYYPVQWSVDSLDWKDYGVDSIINTVCQHKELKPGAIILCHNGAKYTADALDQLLTGLENQGYEIVPISKLILRENYTMDVTGKQIPN